MRNHFASFRRSSGTPEASQADTGWRDFAPLGQGWADSESDQSSHDGAIEDQLSEVSPHHAAKPIAAELVQDDAASVSDLQSPHDAAIEDHPSGGSEIQVLHDGTPEIGSSEDPDAGLPWQLRPAGWKPAPGPGITITGPTTELDGREYDQRLGRLIATLPEGSAERSRMEFARKKGWVVQYDGERIYTKGRT